MILDCDSVLKVLPFFNQAKDFFLLKLKQNIIT